MDTNKLIEERIPKEILNTTVPIDTDGKILGQITVKNLLQASREEASRARDEWWKEKIEKTLNTEKKKYDDSWDYWEWIEEIKNELLNN